MHEARKNSVQNLQTLYGVVAALALTAALDTVIRVFADSLMTVPGIAILLVIAWWILRPSAPLETGAPPGSADSAQTISSGDGEIDGQERGAPVRRSAVPIGEPRRDSSDGLLLRVLTAEDRPVEGARVAWFDAERILGAGTTDAAGELPLSEPPSRSPWNSSLDPIRGASRGGGEAGG